MRRLLASIVLVLGAAPLRGQVGALPPKEDLPVQGRSIGLRVIERIDTTRPSAGHLAGRSIPITLWYPTADTFLSPVNFAEYAALVPDGFRRTPAGEAKARAAGAKALAGYKEFLARAGLSPGEISIWLEKNMYASRHASPAPLRFPLVVIAQGNGDTALDQAFLAERIAAAGFVVATAPSQSVLDGPMRSEADIPAHAEAQAADLAFVRKIVAAEKFVKPGAYGLVGYSFGARSALLLAMRDPDVAALVSLDGGIGSATGKGLFEKARGYDASKMKAPLLHLYETADPAMNVDLGLLDSLPAPKWLIRVDAMRHVHFSTTGVLATRISSVRARTSATAETGAAWDAVAETTVTFLTHFLQGAPGGTWSPPASPLLHAREARTP
jgi:dienelactone hydrolase